MKIKEKLKSFKFLLFITIFLNGTIALWMGKLTGSDWVELVKWLFPAYAVANVLEKWVLSPNNPKNPNKI